MSKSKSLAGFIFITLLQTIILSTTQAKVIHSIPRNQLRKRHFPTINTAAAAAGSGARHLPRPYIPIYDYEQQEYVKAHNDLRQSLGMPPLQWDAKLALSAHLWGLERQKDCDYRNHSGSSYGENTFWMQYREFAPTAVVRKWFSEQHLFDHSTNRCKCLDETDECECGHYLNVIWKTTERIGCSGSIYCDEGKGVLVICNYDPPGNHEGVNPLNPFTPQENFPFGLF